jgi:hypothetical protein
MTTGRRRSSAASRRRRPRCRAATICRTAHCTTTAAARQRSQRRWWLHRLGVRKNHGGGGARAGEGRAVKGTHLHIEAPREQLRWSPVAPRCPLRKFLPGRCLHTARGAVPPVPPLPPSCPAPHACEQTAHTSAVHMHACPPARSDSRSRAGATTNGSPRSASRHHPPPCPYCPASCTATRARTPYLNHLCTVRAAACRRYRLLRRAVLPTAHTHGKSEAGGHVHASTHTQTRTPRTPPSAICGRGAQQAHATGEGLHLRLHCAFRAATWRMYHRRCRQRRYRVCRRRAPRWRRRVQRASAPL